MPPAEGINAAFKFAERRQVPPAALNELIIVPTGRVGKMPPH